MHKYFILTIFAVCYVTAEPERPVIRYPPEVQDKVLDSIKTCSSNNADGSELIRIIRYGDVEFRCDEEFKQLIYCSLNKSGFVNNNGTINIPLVSSVYPNKELMTQLFTDCDRVGDSPVELAYSEFKCYQSNTPYLVELKK